MKNSYHQRGLGLIELSLVIAILAGITIAVLAYFTIALREARITSAIKQITEVVEASYIWVRAEPNFQFISMQKLADNRLINPDWGTGKGINPWGGDFEVSYGINALSVKVDIRGIPGQQVCISLQEKLANKASNTKCQVAGREARYIGEF